MALMSRDTDVENRLADTAEGEGGVMGESGAAVCIAVAKGIAGRKLLRSRSALCDDLRGGTGCGRVAPRGGNMCAHVAESHCTAETHTHCKATILQF